MKSPLLTQHFRIVFLAHELVLGFNFFYQKHSPNLSYTAINLKVAGIYSLGYIDENVVQTRPLLTEFLPSVIDRKGLARAGSWFMTEG